MTRDADRIAGDLQDLTRRVTSHTPIRQAVIAVESGDRSFRWIGAAGGTETDGARVSKDTPFFLASIDKLFNATITMKLSESGGLDLDAPISACLPPALARGLHRLGGADLSDRITVRHLLSHTSGLADWLEDRPKGGASLVERLLEEGDMAFTLEAMADHVRDRLTPHFPPQDLSARRPRARYSDTNFMLLIAILESLTGEPLHRVHERMLFRPLGLRHSYFPGLSRPLDPTPEPMILREVGRPMRIPLFLRSIRGVYGTAADMIGFLRQLMRNTVFDDPGTLSAMTANMNRFGLPFDRAALRAPGWPIEYGLGIMRFRLPRIFSPLHPMPQVLGHTGSTGCWLFYCPRLDVFLSGGVDEVSAGALPFRIVPRILRLLRDPR